jgi:hypothetical protein
MYHLVLRITMSYSARLRAVPHMSQEVACRPSSAAGNLMQLHHGLASMQQPPAAADAAQSQSDVFEACMQACMQACCTLLCQCATQGQYAMIRMVL